MDISVQPDFNLTLGEHNLGPLTRGSLTELQINLGYLCNQACEHCHVDAGPKRTEMMSWQTMERIVGWAGQNNIQAADLTGGAPEMIPHFREFVDALLDLDMRVTSRCNITILLEPGYEDLAEWYAKRNIQLVCSLPCYSRENVDQQRGKGAFGKSIDGLQRLNALGYGRDPEKNLNLVYNPVGPVLPPPQQSLEADYKSHLKEDFDIDFNNLFTITNLPINRYEHYLKRTGQLESYMQLLVESFNPLTVEPLMCRQLVSVDWQGYVYDCDFNQMLNIPLGAARGRTQLWDINSASLDNADIAVAKHCFGCTAGAGSSCGGALA